MIQDDMTNAIVATAVKHMGGSLPNLEFVMNPMKLQDLTLECGIRSKRLVHQDDNWIYRGVPIRKDSQCSGWILRVQ